MKIKNIAIVGSLESNDVMITIEPLENKLEIIIESIVYDQFNEEIKKAVQDICDELEVEQAKIKVNDRGALECTIKARMEAAIIRGKGEIL